jgi:hypothetical protein
LDKEAARFARALQSHLEYGSDQEYLFSGHDIERWLFKVAMGLYSGKILIVSFDGRFLKSRAFLDCIINPVIGNRAGGLYISDIEERVVLDYEEFVVAPVTFPKTQNFSVIKYYFFGIPFTLIFHGDLVDSLQHLMPSFGGGDDVLRIGAPDEGFRASGCAARRNP